MRYLRMLSNSFVAGVVATCYVIVLVLQLNPAFPLSPAKLAPLVQTFGLFYAANLTVIFYVMLTAGQLLAREPFSPAWISVGVLSWLGAAAAAGGAALMWTNVRTFALVLEPGTVQRISVGIVALASASLLLVIVALVRRRTEVSRGALAASVFVIVVGSIAVPLSVRGRAVPQLLESHPLGVVLDETPPESGRRVTIVAIDAGSFDLIVNAAAEGRLPNFGRVLDAGAAAHLATLHPTSAEAVWTAVATGKLPQKNGVRSAGIYRLPGDADPVQLLPEFCFANGLVRFGFLSEQPYTSTALRTHTLWSILSTLGIQVGVVNWPLTYPAPTVRGYLVSDLYARLAPTLSGIDNPSMLYPPDLQFEALPVFQAPQPAVPQADIPERFQAAARIDRVNDLLAQMLSVGRPPQVAVVRYESLDPIGHYFLRYALPSAFGDVTEEERRRLGSVLEGHYALIDEAIGRAIRDLGPDDLLLVVSAYGMEPLSPWRRILEWMIGDPELSGSHDGAPDGFLMAYGSSVAKTRSLRRASVVDIVPTVLYFLGLPIGRDMDGYVRTDLFQPAFIEERPITFIPTYDR